MRLLHALCSAVIVLFAMTAAARAATDPWATLAQRIVATDPSAELSTTLGAEPPGFVFPLSERPALPVLGSTWFASATNAQPVIAHIYYAPTSHTGTASESLFAQLRAAGYTRLPDPEMFPSYGTSLEGRVQHMCPRDLRRPAIDVRIDRMDGLPAMDLGFRLHAESTTCRDAVVAPDVNAHMPVLTGIPDATFRARMTSPGPAIEAYSPFSTGTVRTSLPPGAAVSKLAERFVAKGWTARPAVVADRMITQRFTCAGTARRLEALLVFDRRSEGVYDVMIALTDSALDAAGR
jgi:hypothetical protein